jgi:hypothetical protein
MKKTLTALAAAAVVAIAATAAPSTADARCFGCAARALLAASLPAIVGGAIANSGPPRPTTGSGMARRVGYAQPVAC